jgi:DNA uptake protein ComE-like DNA-binding protein
MRRVSIFLAGISLLLTSLVFGVPVQRALAMNTNSGSSCENSGFPAPYSGGADIAKFFHLSDGSTVTITVTGAVIKQGRCGNPYREGWINVSDICSINSAQDLNGRLASGSSNPYGSASFTGCSSNTQNSSRQQTSGTINIVNNNSQSQSQAQAQSSGSGTQTAATASTHTTSAAASVQAASTTTQPAAQQVSATKTLPNTGPGNILMLSGATTAVGTLGHWYYSRRGRQ